MWLCACIPEMAQLYLITFNDHHEVNYKYPAGTDKNWHKTGPNVGSVSYDFRPISAMVVAVAWVRVYVVHRIPSSSYPTH